MSIWCSREAIGFDDAFEDGATNRGQVRAYATGWSNHYPTTDVEAEAMLSLATVPPWCVPGHRDEYADGVYGPWVRLDIDSEGARTWWSKGVDGNPEKQPVHASVVLDEEAARLLVVALTEWLDAPKVHPTIEGEVA